MLTMKSIMLMYGFASLIGLTTGYFSGHITKHIKEKEHKEIMALHDFPSLDDRIANEPKQPDYKPEKYAFLLGGRSEATFREILEGYYDMLVENGYEEDNIYFLDGCGNSPSFRHVDGKSTKANIDILLKHLTARLDTTDDLFVLLEGHGCRGIDIKASKKIDGITLLEYLDIKYESSFILSNDGLGAKDFTGKLKKMNVRQGVAIFGQCYAGEFADSLGKGGWTAVSASSSEGAGYDWFMESMLSELQKDKDRKVSVKKAFETSKDMPWYILGFREYPNPQLNSSVDPDSVFIF